jgi:hypothetical protein
MTVDLVNMTHSELERRRDALLVQIADPASLRDRADRDAISADERDLLTALDEVEFLLGADG